MEARPGNGAKANAVAKPPRERLLPLSYVEFFKPVPIDGFPCNLRRFRKGEKPDRDIDKECPKMFIDPELQAVVIDGKHFPMHLVFFYERAKAA